MEEYKAKIYPGKFLDVFLSLTTGASFAIVLVSLLLWSMGYWEEGILLIIIPISHYVFSRLLRRRLAINIFQDGIDIHYLPQLFIQRGKTVRISFADVADCKSGKIRFGRFRNWYFIILLNNGKKYKLRSWIPPFQDVNTYATNCEQDITAAFGEFRRNMISPTLPLSS